MHTIIRRPAGAGHDVLCSARVFALARPKLKMMLVVSDDVDKNPAIDLFGH